MKFVFFSVLILLKVYCEDWAILLSGIGNWDLFSYPAEADIGQAYYQLTHGGISPDHIITFMMNTSAYDPKNPFPGEIYEHEGGPNVFDYIKDHIDYSLHDNTPENFLKVLRGDDMTGIGSGRTLKSNKGDNVFVFTFQHGDLGYLVFHYETEEQLKVMYADDLISTIKTMKSRGMFSRLFWNQLSCYSGSIWNKEFDEDDQVFFVTAAPPDREAFLCSYSAKINMFTTGCLHRSLLEMGRKNPSSSLLQFFQSAYSKKLQIPWGFEEYCNYGNLDITNTSLSDFIGVFNSKSESEKQKTAKKRKLDIIDSITMKMSTSFTGFNKDVISDNKEHNLVFHEVEGNKYIDHPKEEFSYDIYHPMCDFFPKMNQNCVHIAVSRYFEVFQKQEPPHYSREHCIVKCFNWLRYECSKEKPNTEEIAQKLVAYCKLYP